MRLLPRLITALLLMILPLRAFAGEAPFYFGGDISALSELEKFGAVFNEHDQPKDAIAILRGQGMNLFRLRLFVNPDHDFDKNYGATQDLPMVLALARRIKNAGAQFSLAMHYSDTWADPKQQTKPAAWKDLPLNVLQKKSR